MRQQRTQFQNDQTLAKLSVDILMMIFIKASESEKSNFSNRTYMSITRTLSLTCGRFYDIIQSNPSYWRTLRTDMSRSTLARHLEHLGNHDVRVHLKFPIVGSERAILNEIAALENNKIYALNIYVQEHHYIEEMPQLLRMNAPRINLNSVERLDIAYIKSSSCYINMTGFRNEARGAYNNTKIMEIKNATAPAWAYQHAEEISITTFNTNIFQKMAELSSVRYLNLDYRPLASTFLSSPMKQRILQNLVFLSLDVKGQPTTRIFKILCMPRIQQIVIRTDLHGRLLKNIFPDDAHYPNLTKLALVAKYSEHPADYQPLGKFIKRFSTIELFSFGHEDLDPKKCLAALKIICDTLYNTKIKTQLRRLCIRTDISKEWPELSNDINKCLGSRGIELKYMFDSI